MNMRYVAARVISAASTWGLKNVFRRPAANFPGKIALYADPFVIGHAKAKLKLGSIAIVGTNGKTTVTNLLADVLEQAGHTVICNRTGANLDSGVATALLHGETSDWGVFESDELWLAKIAPQLRPDYVLLLNLFRDQLDRCGEIDRIQDSIVGALASSPQTVLIYNADDPLCTTIAKRASEQPERSKTPSIAFGVKESMGLAQNTVTDATMCQFCSTMFTYAWRQYGQLGEYECPNCHFARPKLDFAAEHVDLTAQGMAFDVVSEGAKKQHTAGQTLPDIKVQENGPCATQQIAHVHASFTGAYMVYNLLAVTVTAHLLGCSQSSIQAAIDSFDPQNGRLQSYVIGGRKVLLNLAKNPTGFNQNLKIVNLDKGHPAVAFFINDKEADGHDVSWLWDIDFEELRENEPTRVFAGGVRGADMAVRLKYADVRADRVNGPQGLLEELEKIPPSVNAYIIANYTALPTVKAVLDAAADGERKAFSADTKAVSGTASETASQGAAVPGVQGSSQTEVSSLADESGLVSSPAMTPLRIAHLFPDLLNLYGDGGNVRVLEQRLRWRGIPVEVVRVNHEDALDLDNIDLVMMGGSPDREQRLASNDLLAMAEDLRAYVDADAPLLAICGSYQMLGRQWLLDGEEVPGLGILPMTTSRPGTSADRLTSNIILDSSLVEMPVVGYENHAGRTFLDEGLQSFGHVISSAGLGNNEQSHEDGVLYKGVIGTYLHGPLLSKNPQVADELLSRALLRHHNRTNEPLIDLVPLDDSLEEGANQELVARLVKSIGR